jgi:hypothetical protein
MGQKNISAPAQNSPQNSGQTESGQSFSWVTGPREEERRAPSSTQPTLPHTDLPALAPAPRNALQKPLTPAPKAIASEAAPTSKPASDNWGTAQPKRPAPDPWAASSLNAKAPTIQPSNLNQSPKQPSSAAPPPAVTGPGAFPGWANQQIGALPIAVAGQTAVPVDEASKPAIPRKPLPGLNSQRPIAPIAPSDKPAPDLTESGESKPADKPKGLNAFMPRNKNER